MQPPKTILCDIDGTLIQHNGSLLAQITSPPIPLKGTLETLRKWDQKGYNIILTTGRRESCRAVTEKQLQSVGIFYDQLIMGMGGGPRILINDRKSGNKVDTSFSFNVERNAGIGNIDI
jgi:phosphoglycolate phosphatase-like HAD superfamily hydrolase